MPRQPCLWSDSEGQAPPGVSSHSASGFQWALEGPGQAQCAVMWVWVLPSCVQAHEDLCVAHGDMV